MKTASWALEQFASVSSKTFQLTGTLTAGRTVVVELNWQASGNNVASPTSVTLGGVSMTLATEAKFNDGFANTNCTATYYLHNVAGGSNVNVVVSFSTGGTYGQIAASEHSGLVNAAPNLTTAQTADVDPIACASGTLPTASQLVFFLGVNAKGTSQTWPTPTGGGYAWTLGINVLDWNNATSGFVAQAYATSTTGFTATTGTAGGAHNGISRIVSFEVAAGNLTVALPAPVRGLRRTVGPSAALALAAALPAPVRGLRRTVGPSASLVSNLTVTLPTPVRGLRRSTGPNVALALAAALPAPSRGLRRTVGPSVSLALSVALPTPVRGLRRAVGPSAVPSTIPPNIVHVGNSLFDGSIDGGGSASTYRMGGPNGLPALLPGATHHEVNGLGTNANIIANYTSLILPLKVPGAINIINFGEWHNQAETYKANPATVTAGIATMISDFNAFVSQAHADGWLVFTGTIPPFDEADWQYVADEANLAILKNTTADYVVDFRASAPLFTRPGPGIANGNPRFSGPVHFSGQGYQEYSQLYALHLAAFLAGKKLVTLGTPSRYRLQRNPIAVSALAAAVPSPVRGLRRTVGPSAALALAAALPTPVRGLRRTVGPNVSFVANLTIALPEPVRGLRRTVGPSVSLAAAAAVPAPVRGLRRTVGPSVSLALAAALPEPVRGLRRTVGPSATLTANLVAAVPEPMRGLRRTVGPSVALASVVALPTPVRGLRRSVAPAAALALAAALPEPVRGLRRTVGPAVSLVANLTIVLPEPVRGLRRTVGPSVALALVAALPEPGRGLRRTVGPSTVFGLVVQLPEPVRGLRRTVGPSAVESAIVILPISRKKLFVVRAQKRIFNPMNEEKPRFYKDLVDVEPVGFDWGLTGASYLEPGETLTSSVWEVDVSGDGQLVLGTGSNGSPAPGFLPDGPTFVWLRAGAAGVYEVSNKITTSNGRTKKRSFIVEMVDN